MKSVPSIAVVVAILAGRMPVVLAGDTDLVAVDHLVYAAADLDAGIAAIETLTGVRAVQGGSHPGKGTRNALLALGAERYLEIIAPDPAQADFTGNRIFHIDEVTEPRLVTWAAKSADVAMIASIKLPDGSSTGTALAGSRARPDGIVLAWTFTDPTVEIADGIVPFFIDWGETPHPATAAPAGVVLVGLRAEHPEPEGVRALLDALGVDLPVDAGRRPGLVAILDTPRGRVELR